MTQPYRDQPAILLVAATTGYQVRMFGDAAARIGLPVALATDRCDQLDDPWRDGAIPIRFHEEDAAIHTIVEEAATRPIGGVLAVGDRPAVIAALAARALHVPFHPPEAARVSANKLMTRVRLQEAGLPGPWFRSVPVDVDAQRLADELEYPAVVKPLALAASRGVIRANTPAELVAGIERVAALLQSRDVRAQRDPAHDVVLVEGYVPGREVAVEGLVTQGVLRALAVFDKPDPMEGPFFEETIYVTPPDLTEFERRRVVRQVEAAVQAVGLRHGPVHVECRLGEREVVVLEVAARPIGGLCARVLRFDGPGGATSLEELLLRHAAGEAVTVYREPRDAAAVMMIPIPAAGVFKRVSGLEEARLVQGVEDVVITAKPDQRFVPWPEGASYPGFIFARGERADGVVAAVRAAHARLRFEVDREIPVSTDADST